MPVFISYSHSDSDFVEMLAVQLVKHRTYVWIDKWELNVGDSLISRIEGAIAGASALLVILSKASVESEWCKKELSAGLVRELEERRVIVLPVLIEDCTRPLFLRDKVYADFRTNVDDGLRAVLRATARITSDSMARVETPQGHMDWSIEIGFSDDDGTLFLQLFGIEQASAQRYTVLTQIVLIGNVPASKSYRRLQEAGLDWIEEAVLIDSLVNALAKENVQLVLIDANRQKSHMQLSQGPEEYLVEISSRRLGEDTGMDVVVDVAGQLAIFRDSLTNATRRPTAEEIGRVRKIQSESYT